MSRCLLIGAVFFAGFATGALYVLGEWYRTIAEPVS